MVFGPVAVGCYRLLCKEEATSDSSLLCGSNICARGDRIIFQGPFFIFFVKKNDYLK